MGRPTKINETLKSWMLYLYQDGKVDHQVAEITGISEATINNWKKEHPEFFESIKDAKASVDDEVEAALLKNCLGYE